MSLYNADELDAPKWLNEAFFELALRTYQTDEDIEVLQLDLSPASMKGDHYASVMYRAKLQYRSRKKGPTAKKSLIIKTLPDEGMKRDMLMQSRLFETEIDMYTKTLPRIEQILAAHGDPLTLAPKIVYHSLQPNKIIVLEDLCESGYSVLRDRFANEQEVLAIYRKLAKLHAVGYALGQSEEHELVSKYREGIFNSSFMLESDVLKNGISRFIDMLSAHDEFDEYVDKFRKLKGQLFAECKDLYRAYQSGVKDEICVLNHGDFHLKNRMFKFNEKRECVDFRMVDFQVCVYGPPVIDLIYSNYMLLGPEMRDKHDYFVRQYFEQFIETLQRIKYEGELPAFADIKISLLRYRHFTAFMLSTLLPVIFSLLSVRPEDMKDVDSTKVFQNTDSIAMLYRNPAFIAEIKRILPKLLQAGYFD